MTGFEPATPSSRTTYATGLRYIPNGECKNIHCFNKIAIILMDLLQNSINKASKNSPCANMA